MKKEFNSFKGEMDEWVKQFNGELAGYRPALKSVIDNTENIDHNYEILQEMRSEITKLKEELSALRLVQILHLRSEIKKETKNQL
jgi:hypothetical protein